MYLKSVGDEIAEKILNIWNFLFLYVVHKNLLMDWLQTKLKRYFH